MMYDLPRSFVLSFLCPGLLHREFPECLHPQISLQGQSLGSIEGT